jgi:SAM-dependent methyltransferase
VNGGLALIKPADPAGRVQELPMNWKIKGVLQRALARTPGGVQVNDLLQRSVGGLREFDAYVDSRVIDDWIPLALLLRGLDYSATDAQLLEVGTGWMPTLPLCFGLAGARSCHTYDLTRHLSSSLTFRMLTRLEAHLKEIAVTANVPEDAVRERYRAYREAGTLDDVCRAAGITYNAPADASHTSLPNSSIDIVFSNNVLEHVEPLVIGDIMRETNRLLRERGVAIHSVNCGDHYAYCDDTISQVNYLQYSDEEWRPWNNRLQYQNRLRACEFLRFAKGAGLAVVYQELDVADGVAKQLDSMRIAPQFEAFSAEELRATTVRFAARLES